MKVQVEFVNLHLGQRRMTVVVSDEALPPGKTRRVLYGWEVKKSLSDDVPPEDWHRTVMMEVSERRQGTGAPPGFGGMR